MPPPRRRELRALLDDLDGSFFSEVNLSMALVCLGDFDDAFESLERAAQTHDMLFVSITTHALYDPLRDDPRFPALLARHGLQTVALA